MPAARKSTTSPSGSAAGAFTAGERAAMKERAAELKAEKQARTAAEQEAEVLERIAEMADPDRVLAERLHALVREVAPHLQSRTWYGMPAYARDGKVVCFFKPAVKFKSRYATLGFEDAAALDDGAMWPTSFALASWTADAEARIAALLRRAVG